MYVTLICMFIISTFIIIAVGMTGKDIIYENEITSWIILIYLIPTLIIAVALAISTRILNKIRKKDANHE